MKTVSNPKRSVLLIDDNLVNVKLISTILERENFLIWSTSNSLEAVPMALLHNPDIILLDIVMPGIDGMEILRLLKTDPATANIPVVMVTARSKGHDVQAALEAGAFDYVKKPIDDVEVVARVRSALRFRDHQARLVELAMRDSLTGLYNHNLLIDFLEREITTARRTSQPVTFCMADIDHFKKINDQYGHQVGDYVLREIGEVFQKCLRKSDPVGRYGGEEFGIVLGSCPVDRATVLCERLRERVMKHRFVHSGIHLSITISLGLAQHNPGDSSTEKELIRRADEALYRAKEKGRNCLVLAS